jgi:ubiquinone/menaquinone biosynthesis C-methylase UbiE
MGEAELESTKIKTVVREYWRKSAERYDKYHKTEEEYITWKEFLKTVIPSEVGLRVLDVGTGTGVIALPLAATGHNVTALDLTAEMMEKAKANARQRGLAIDFRIGDAEKLPFADNTFDVVINKWLLWTLPNPEKAISEWHRVLKPGGCLIIIDGNWWDFRKSWTKQTWHHFLAMPLILITEGRWDKDYEHKHLQHLPMTSKKRPEADVELLEDFGFVAVEAQALDIPIAQTFIMWLKYGYQGRQFLAKGVKA